MNRKAVSLYAHSIPKTVRSATSSSVSVADMNLVHDAAYWRARKAGASEDDARRFAMRAFKDANI